MNRFSCFLPQNNTISHNIRRTNRWTLPTSNQTDGSEPTWQVKPRKNSKRRLGLRLPRITVRSSTCAWSRPILGGPYFYFGHLKFSFHPPLSPRVTSWMKVVAKRYCSLSGPEFVAWQLKVLEHSIRKKEETPDPRVNLPAQISRVVGLWWRLWVVDGEFSLLKEGCSEI